MSASEHNVTTGLGRVAVRTTGDFHCGRTPLVLWPSLMMDSRLWSHQVAFFADRIPTVCIDPPGHGHSDPLRRDFVLEDCVAVIESVLNHLGIGYAHIAGNSWGAMTSALFGAMRPERTSSLILITGTAGKASLGHRIQFRTVIAVVSMAHGIPPMLGARMERMFFAPGIAERNPEALQLLHDSITRCDPVSFPHAARSVLVNRGDRHGMLRNITAPTLVVSGKYDRVFPPADGERMSAAIPDALFVIVEDAAHLLSAEVPDTINELIADHLSRIEATPG